MPDIFHNFPVKSSATKVFEHISSSEGLDKWWTKHSAATPEPGGEYLLDFGPGYRWKAIVTQYEPDRAFELRITEADADWNGTTVGFTIETDGNNSDVHFYHTGWQLTNEHFKISSFCWAMYLRILKRSIEKDERVPYEKRLDV